MANHNYLETYTEGVKLRGIQTKKPVLLSGTAATLAVGGTSTFTGVTTFTAAPVFTAAPSGPMGRPVSTSALVGATVVLTAADSGKVFINVSTSGTPSWTLPTAANGLWFTFVTGNTTAGFTITGGVVHLKTNASGTALTSTTTVTNTQGTAVVGDTLSIVCDGTAWWMTAQSGIFAAS